MLPDLGFQQQKEGVRGVGARRSEEPGKVKAGETPERAAGEKMQEKEKNWDKFKLLSSPAGREGLSEAVECCKPAQGCTIFSSA